MLLVSIVTFTVVNALNAVAAGNRMAVLGALEVTVRQALISSLVESMVAFAVLEVLNTLLALLRVTVLRTFVGAFLYALLSLRFVSIVALTVVEVMVTVQPGDSMAVPWALVVADTVTFAIFLVVSVMTDTVFLSFQAHTPWYWCHVGRTFVHTHVLVTALLLLVLEPSVFAVAIVEALDASLVLLRLTVRRTLVATNPLDTLPISSAVFLWRCAFTVLEAPRAVCIGIGNGVRRALIVALGHSAFAIFHFVRRVALAVMRVAWAVSPGNRLAVVRAFVPAAGRVLHALLPLLDVAVITPAVVEAFRAVGRPCAVFWANIVTFAAIWTLVCFRAEERSKQNRNRKLNRLHLSTYRQGCRWRDVGGFQFQLTV